MKRVDREAKSGIRPWKERGSRGFVELGRRSNGGSLAPVKSMECAGFREWSTWVSLAHRSGGIGGTPAKVRWFEEYR